MYDFRKIRGGPCLTYCKTICLSVSLIRFKFILTSHFLFVKQTFSALNENTKLNFGWIVNFWNLSKAVQ